MKKNMKRTKKFKKSFKQKQTRFLRVLFEIFSKIDRSTLKKDFIKLFNDQMLVHTT
jgi:hypothetical protein